MLDATTPEAMNFDGLMQMLANWKYAAIQVPKKSRTLPLSKLTEFCDRILCAFQDVKQTCVLSLQRLETLLECLEADQGGPAGNAGKEEQLSDPCKVNETACNVDNSFMVLT